MPQMMPMNWTLMFMMLNIILMLLMITMIYNNKNSTYKTSSKTKITMNKWLW